MKALLLTCKSGAAYVVRQVRPLSQGHVFSKSIHPLVLHPLSSYQQEPYTSLFLRAAAALLARTSSLGPPSTCAPKFFIGPAIARIAAAPSRAYARPSTASLRRREKIGGGRGRTRSLCCIPRRSMGHGWIMMLWLSRGGLGCRGFRRRVERSTGVADPSAGQ